MNEDKKMDEDGSKNEDSNKKKRRGCGKVKEKESKSKLLNKVFGMSDRKETSMYVILISTLEVIEHDFGMKPEIRVRSKSYKDGLLRYETIISAFVFLTIYDFTTPLSNYLKTSGLDVLKAFQFVKNVIKKLEDLRSDFANIKQKADDFVSWAQTKLSERDVQAEIETELPIKRIIRRKKMPGEQSNHEIIENPDEAFKVQVHFVVVDTIVASLKRRVDSDSQRSFADLSLLDPKNFSEIRDANDMPSQVFEELSKKILKFDDKATPDNIRKELISLADNWDTIKNSSLEAYIIKEQEEVLDEEEYFVEKEENDNISSTKLCNS